MNTSTKDNSNSEVSKVDVLIIGAGPAGLMAAAGLTKYGIHDIRIIDKRSTQIYTGQADGLNPRTLEIFQALGIGSRIMDEMIRFGEVCHWEPNESGEIRRTARSSVTPRGISKFQSSCLNQGRIEEHLMNNIARWSMSTKSTNSDSNGPSTSKKVIVERAVCPASIRLPSITSSPLSDKDEDQITLTLRHLSESEAKPAQFLPAIKDGLFRSSVFDGEASELDANPHGLPVEESLETIQCKFVIGTDGARSWTRSALGYKLIGDSLNSFWGVLDGVPATDFPDVRGISVIHSAENGALMIIPRERNLVRLYIQLPQPVAGQRPNRNDITPEKLLQATNSILAPYTLRMPDVDWYTCYEVGQRLADSWHWNNRVFIAGDACHTHSPKAGQGMNTSMADTFNLAWKLAHVLQKKADPKILSTYEVERSKLAHELITYDRKYSALFSGKPAKDKDDSTGISLKDFHQIIEQSKHFISGTSADYDSNVLIVKETDSNLIIKSRPHLAKRTPIGIRLPSNRVVCLSDAVVYETLDLIPADGKWKLLIFPGHIQANEACKTKLDQLSNFLANDKSSPILRYTSTGEDFDSVIDCITIVSSSRTTLELTHFHQILRPLKGPHKFGSYRKIFTDEASYHEGHDHAYEKFGINPDIGCIIVARPDQHVSLILDLNDHLTLSSFFDQFMISPHSTSSSRSEET
ncbi:FAD binding domain-containing protein [Melampsora americana]|nr:FAD binding domain-containing protein [Melampsora americana]